MRESLQLHRDDILGLAVEETVSRQSFASSLLQKVAEVDSIASYESPSFIKIASIDVDVNVIHQLLRDLQTDKRFSAFFESSLGDYGATEVLSGDGVSLVAAEKCSFVLTTHVTLAHFRHMSQADLRSTFQPICGSIVKLSATGLLWNDRVAALAVTVAGKTDIGDDLPPSRNSFPHITVWFQEDASAVDANLLPDLCDKGKARRVDFESPIPLEGKVLLWEL